MLSAKFKEDKNELGKYKDNAFTLNIALLELFIGTGFNALLYNSGTPYPYHLMFFSYLVATFVGIICSRLYKKEISYALMFFVIGALNAIYLFSFLSNPKLPIVNFFISLILSFTFISTLNWERALRFKLANSFIEVGKTIKKVPQAVQSGLNLQKKFGISFLGFFTWFIGGIILTRIYRSKGYIDKANQVVQYTMLGISLCLVLIVVLVALNYRTSDRTQTEVPLEDSRNLMPKLEDYLNE